MSSTFSAMFPTAGAVYPASVGYNGVTLTQRDFPRQIQVPNATRQLRLNASLGPLLSGSSTQGATIYDCSLDFRGNALTNATSLILTQVRGVITIPNIVTGINNVLTFNYNGVGHTITFAQGMYNLGEFGAELARLMNLATAPGTFVTAVDVARGTVTVTNGAGLQLFYTSEGNMARNLQFAVFPLTAAVSQTITGAWLFLTRVVGIQLPEITRMVSPPGLGNVTQLNGSLVTLFVRDPSAPMFIDQRYDFDEICVPFNIDDRLDFCTLQLRDDQGRSLAGYCSQISDWLHLTFTVLR